jgi:cellulose synthase/poly-beta-1,6-N-acetylglucosamine synthase-like glycosyltransferase
MLAAQAIGGGMRRQAQHRDGGQSPGPPGRRPKIAAALLLRGKVGADDILNALADHGREAAPLPEVLRARGLVDERDVLDVRAESWGLQRLDIVTVLPDPRLVDLVGPKLCLTHGLVPWRRAGAVTVVAVSHPEAFHALRPELEARLGPVCAGLATERDIVTAVLALRGGALAEVAEHRVPLAESCRNWPRLRDSPKAMTCLVLFAILLLVAPVATGLALLGLALVTLLCAVLLKVAAMLAALSQQRPSEPTVEAEDDAIVSIIVALYRESEIAARLVRRLARLDYPEQLLEAVIAVEAGDDMTREALAAAALPVWMRVVVVPEGNVKTKPRALNHALAHCRGEIVGIYDAEDEPEVFQIRKVVARFREAGPKVACLQGVLDYYNPRTNWLSRCFTIEYAGWFRLILPGIARLGLVVPLGGTTLFFRRDVLETLGGWDAHNVTEDADLGVRLARHGYRTELIGTITREEANCRAITWVRQRSRWIKGYMVTWAVHMRDPELLWRQLGPRAFVGFQILFLGTILQFLLAPLMWSLLLVPFGVAHPLIAVLPPAAFWATMAAFLMSEVASLAVGIIAIRRTDHQISAWWVPTMKLYFPLATLAAYKALVELMHRPYYWDKTTHGIYDHLTEDGA